MIDYSIKDRTQMVVFVYFASSAIMYAVGVSKLCGNQKENEGWRGGGFGIGLFCDFCLLRLITVITILQLTRKHLPFLLHNIFL